MAFIRNVDSKVLMLQGEGSEEEARAIAAEQALDARLDILELDPVTNSFAEIVTSINSVDTTNDQAFASYVLSNDAALAEEVSINNEISARVNAVGLQSGKIWLFRANVLDNPANGVRHRAGFYSLSDGLSSDEADSLATIVQTFQTTLGRQV